MPEFQFDLGGASFLLPNAKIRLVSEASVNVSSGAASVKGSDSSLSSIITSDVWTSCKPYLSISLFVSFEGKNLLSPLVSRRAFLMQLAETLSQAELWSQLQLRADVDISQDLQEHSRDPAILRIVLRQRFAADNYQSEHTSQVPDYLDVRENVIPPWGVSTLLLCAVNISFVFSCSRSTAFVPQKRPRSVEEASLDLLRPTELPRAARRRLAVCDVQGMHFRDLQEAAWQCLSGQTDMSDLDDNTVAIPSTSSYVGSAEPFAVFSSSASGVYSDGAQNLTFSSQGSTLAPSQDAPPAVASEPWPSLHLQSIKALIDGALRTFICAKPIATAPGLRTETSTLQARLTDIAPSVFTPGYATAVAARMPLVPTVARLLTSFMQKSNSAVITTKKAKLIQQFSSLQPAENLEQTDQSLDEVIMLKQVVKKHLWMTMTNKLRRPESARRLRPLQPIAKTDNVQTLDSLDMETTSGELCRSGEDFEYEMLSEDLIACPWLMCHHIFDDCEMLEYEEDDYECDLFEAYEERLKNHFGNDVTTPKLDTITQTLAPPDAVCKFSSHMPEMLQEFPQLEPAGEEIGTSPTPNLDISLAATTADAVPTTNIGTDDDWNSLLDEGSPPQLTHTNGNKTVSEPNTSLEDGWEPDFEQWEFDIEQGSDDMLF